MDFNTIIDRTGTFIGTLLRDGASMEDVRKGLACGFLGTYRIEEGGSPTSADGVPPAHNPLTDKGQK